MPILTVIAGPNGAGKSTVSKELLSDSGIEAFDFDKEFYSIWSGFSYDPLVEQGAFSQAQELYKERRSLALESGFDFAFETNYHTKEVLDVVDRFKSKGYRTELIFICLENPELAIERVKLRVVRGGHSVEESTIRSRFEAGLKMFDETFDKFDLVTVYTSEPNRVLLSYVLEPAQNAMMVLTPIPMALRRLLRRFSNYPSFGME